MTEKTTKKRTIEEKRQMKNVIYDGHKTPMSYVFSVITQFNDNGSNGVVLKARGRSISTAVDKAEIVKNRFIKDIKVKEIIIITESVTNEEGRNSNISSIEIDLFRK